MSGRFMIIRILHASICAGPLFFLAIAYWTGPKNAPNYLFPYVGLFICLALIPVAFMMLRQRERISRSLAMVNEKLRGYQTGKIIQWAVLEGASFVNAAIYFIGGSWINFGASLFCVLVIVASAPRLTEFRERFKVNEVEFREFHE